MAKVAPRAARAFGDRPAPADVARHAVRLPGERRRAHRRGSSSFFATSVGPADRPSRRTGRATSTRSPSATAVARIREAALRLGRTRQPELRAPASGPAARSRARSATSSRAAGIVTMASAAALTLGVVTIPVYEIYKVGEDPHWLDGPRPARAGDRAAGRGRPALRQRRGRQPRHALLLPGRATAARRSRRALPADAFVLGVDSHTALVLDLDAGPPSVAGLGGVTVRAGGRSVVFPTAPRRRSMPSRRRPMSCAPSGHAATVPGSPTAGRDVDRARARLAAADRLRRARCVTTSAGSRARPSMPRGAGRLPRSARSWSSTRRSSDGRCRRRQPGPDAAQAILRLFVVRLGDVAVDGRGPGARSWRRSSRPCRVQPAAATRRTGDCAPRSRPVSPRLGVEVDDGTDVVRPGRSGRADSWPPEPLPGEDLT